MAFWARSLIDYGYSYVGVALDFLTPSIPGEKSKKERDKAKRLRKIARASRKKNRQRK